LTTSTEYEGFANQVIGSYSSNDLPGIREIELGKFYATLSVAAAIREQTEQARENTLELACAFRNVASPHPTWYP
jgi:hypothetical protein